MLFNSINFLLFFPFVSVIYYLLPKRVRYIWLLICSYYFYMSWGKKQGLLLFGVTFITYLSGRILDRLKSKDILDVKILKTKKICLCITLILNLILLCYFKYLNYFVETLNRIIGKWQLGEGISIAEVVLPVGISFYIFQALGYVIDVYRDEVYAEKNFLKYALFISFFPQLVAGPIERSKNLLRQLGKPQSFSFENLQRGFLLMLWGFFLKMVIADRAAIIVNTVYGDCTTYYGMYIVFATCLFAVQIYCDFYGYSTIARGAALILGFHLTDNFKAPYFAKNIKEFWQRWHISLTQWFRDYLYIPLGGNRKGPVRKRINLLFVFMVSGLWHGSGLSYVVWGLLNGIYQVVSDVWKPVFQRIYSTFGKDEITKSKPEKKNEFEKNLLKRLCTFFLVSFTWLFFRSGGFNSALILMQRMAHFNWTIFLDHSLYSLGVTEGYFRVLCYSIILLFVIDYKKYMGMNVIEKFMGLSWWVRIPTEMLLIFTILLFGCYGELYDATQFIYFQF